MKTEKILSELNRKYNEKFNELWNNCDGFNQLNLRDLNNLIVKIIKEIKKEAQEDFKKKVEEFENYLIGAFCKRDDRPCKKDNKETCYYCINIYKFRDKIFGSFTKEIKK